MHSAKETIEAYIRAKDGNRPFLMERAFAEDAVLDVAVTTGTISFPPTSSGLESIANTLVREFVRTYENVHTFCLDSPPGHDAATFSCNWLVAMSERENRNVRVGCGRYDWHFRLPTRRAARLKITIQLMESLAPRALLPVMHWVSTLPHPWCPARLALAELPNFPELRVLRKHLANRSA